MSISAEEKKRYFQETAIALRREGFKVEPSVGGRLGVWLDDHPICEVDQIGGITYRSDNTITVSDTNPRMWNAHTARNMTVSTPAL